MGTGLIVALVVPNRSLSSEGGIGYPDRPGHGGSYPMGSGREVHWISVIY
jgi:hypothetical protein